MFIFQGFLSDLSCLLVHLIAIMMNQHVILKGFKRNTYALVTTNLLLRSLNYTPLHLPFVWNEDSGWTGAPVTQTTWIKSPQHSWN